MNGIETYTHNQRVLASLALAASTSPLILLEAAITILVEAAQQQTIFLSRQDVHR